MSPDWLPIPNRPGYYVMTDAAWSRYLAAPETAERAKRINDMIARALGDTSETENGF